MSEAQTNVIADLRYPIESRNADDKDKWSQWTSLSMIEMSARDTYHFVKSMIPKGRQRILEIGSGDGYLALELARDGHEVTGLDTSQAIIEVAERTRSTHPETRGFGELTYHCADIDSWQAEESSFDIVIITRTLHHIHQLQPVLTKVKHLLTSEGRFICQDYAYDRLSEQTATWMYSMQRLLFLSSLSDENPATGADDAHSIEALRTAWFQKSDNRLNRYEDMYQAFQATFHQQFFSWIPYLFVYIGYGMRHVPAEQAHALIPFLRNMEQISIEKEYIQAVGFRYVGHI